MSAIEFVPSERVPVQRGTLRRLWQRLPQNTRTQILFDVSRILAPLPDANPRGGFPLAIAGLFSTASGVGEGARLAYAALDAAGYAPAAFDLSPAFGQVELSEAAQRRALAPGAGSLIVHHNGPYLPHALWTLGRARVRGRRIIGYWAWELPRLPAGWNASFDYLHEIWVPSTFTRDAVAASTDKPVHVVPHPLPPMTATPNMRGKLGLPADALVVLNVFHLGSAFSRKNPLAAIAAFRKAFGDARDRVLAIKLIDNGALWARRELDAAIAGAGNIRLIEGMLPEADMAGLMAAADIVISLHRSEGFGLVPAQAMALGKPVVATAWSGNLEFMNRHNSALVSYSLIPVHDPEGAFQADNQMWADANVEEAAAWLRRLANDADLRARLGAAAAKDVAAQLSSKHFARAVAALIEAAERR
jgi:glycosyltransferase involved in cell wall biosynthesis